MLLTPDTLPQPSYLTLDQHLFLSNLYVSLRFPTRTHATNAFPPSNPRHTLTIIRPLLPHRKPQRSPHTLDVVTYLVNLNIPSATSLSLLRPNALAPISPFCQTSSLKQPRLPGPTLQGIPSNNSSHPTLPPSEHTHAAIHLHFISVALLLVCHNHICHPDY